METRERIINILSESLGLEIDEIHDDSDFVTDLGMDSLDTVEIIMAIEKAFSLSMTDEEISGMKTVGELVKKVEEKLG